MKRIFRGLTGVAALGGAVMLAGCGGGGGGPAPSQVPTTNIDGGLSQGDFRDAAQDRFFDDYLCRATRNAHVFVQLHSTDFDPELFVFRRNADGSFTLLASDDDSGPGNDAYLEFDVDQGADYLIRATPEDSGENSSREFYHIVLSESLGTPVVVVPGPQAAAKSLPPLAAMKKK